MLRGFYTAASGMITQQRQQEALSNNVANVNTPGYKADQTAMRAFPELLMHQMGGAEKVPTINGLKNRLNNPIGSLQNGVYVQEMVPNLAQGDLKETEITTDLALLNVDLPDEDGNIFYTVQDESGEVRYTRNGNFTMDSQGALTTNEGYYVLDEAGNPVQTDGLEFHVTPEGVLQVAGQNIPLGFAYVADGSTLVKEDNDLFNGDAVAVPADAMFQVKQGFLERSNVDALQSMTDMMEAFRMFETNQRVLKAYDESMGKAVSEIGRLG